MQDIIAEVRITYDGIKVVVFKILLFKCWSCRMNRLEPAGNAVGWSD